jgi:hypothetical protein
MRAPNGYGFALKTWRIIARVCSNAARAITLLRALLMLTNLEPAR